MDAGERRCPQSTRLFGKITNIADYGAFVELEPGIEGPVHVSDGLDEQERRASVVALHSRSGSGNRRRQAPYQLGMKRKV
jgi:ribosomal protein S1